MEHGGRPGNARLLGHQASRERQGVRDEQVSAFRCVQGVLVGFPQNRHHQLTDDAVGPLATVHDPPHQLRVGIQVRLIGADRSKAQSQGLNLRTVEGTGGDDGFVASGQ